MKSKEELWWEAFNTCLSTGTMQEIAASGADSAVVLYEKRWPESALTSMIGSPVDLGVLQRAVSQLAASNRFDAHLVMKALYDAIRAAMAKGEQLTSWTPPPRGG
jgi:hypothetical protein